MKYSTAVYNRDDVWAAACAAQRINGEYVKRQGELVKMRERQATISGRKIENDPTGNKLTNVALMRILLGGDMKDITPKDREKGEETRRYFVSLFSLAFTGDLIDFYKSAIMAANLEEVADADKAMPLIACLPSSYERDESRRLDRDKLDSISMNSVPLSAAIGDTVQLEFTVVDCIFKPKFGTYAVNGTTMDDGNFHLVFFFEKGTNWPVGSVRHVSGRIKSIKGNTTQLHYVRELKNFHKATK